MGDDELLVQKGTLHMFRGTHLYFMSLETVHGPLNSLL